MRPVQLLTHRGEKVARVEIAPYPDHLMPEVVVWGERVFVRHGLPDTFFEAFSVVSLTPSPGLDS